MLFLICCITNIFVINYIQKNMQKRSTDSIFLYFFNWFQDQSNYIKITNINTINCNINTICIYNII